MQIHPKILLHKDRKILFAIICLVFSTRYILSQQERKFSNWFSLVFRTGFLGILCRKQLVFLHTMLEITSFLYHIPRCSAITRLAKASDTQRILSPIIKKKCCKFQQRSGGIRTRAFRVTLDPWSGALDRSAILTADEGKRRVRPL